TYYMEGSEYTETSGSDLKSWWNRKAMEFHVRHHQQRLLEDAVERANEDPRFLTGGCEEGGCGHHPQHQGHFDWLFPWKKHAAHAHHTAMSHAEAHGQVCNQAAYASPVQPCAQPSQPCAQPSQPCAQPSQPCAQTQRADCCSSEPAAACTPCQPCPSDCCQPACTTHASPHCCQHRCPDEDDGLRGWVREDCRKKKRWFHCFTNLFSDDDECPCGEHCACVNCACGEMNDDGHGFCRGDGKWWFTHARETGHFARDPDWSWEYEGRARYRSPSEMRLDHLRCHFGYFAPTGSCGAGTPMAGHYNLAYPVNPQYLDPRDGGIYAAQGYGAPMAVPLAPNVGHTYNYGWGVPSSRLTPISRP
ncbi:MAG: hypothetical protein KY476_08025, partial [Planctomycetes bacterium]|nr:hypothetical protein [Planctomycetota bacterium]